MEGSGRPVGRGRDVSVGPPACLPLSRGQGEIPGEKPRLCGDVTVLLEPTAGSAPGFIRTAGHWRRRGRLSAASLGAAWCLGLGGFGTCF